LITITATELKTRLGLYLGKAQTEPIIIEKSGRVNAVIISKERYDELVKIEGG
jgi:prevent-host-death family protein